jgi:hypothetical protein
MESPESPQPSSPGASGPRLGLLFTDAMGRVVFLDEWVLALLGQVRAGELVGEPLHMVFGVSQAAANGLTMEIARNGYIHDYPLVLTRSDGTQIEAICTGIANYTDQHIFIGADLTLGEPNAVVSEKPATHGDILAMRIRRIEAEAAAQHVAKDAIQAHLYISALIGAVHVLLARSGGRRVGQALENTITSRALRSSWPVEFTGGSLVITSPHLPREAYRALIDETIDYAREVVGERPLLQEMHALDAQMGPETRDAAGQFGMRDWTA